MHLKRPPILEVYVRFDFRQQENQPQFNEAVAGRFLETIEGFSPKDFTQSQDITLQWGKDKQPKKLGIRTRLDRVRACYADETRWLQVGPAYLAYNILRKSEDVDYPGYEVLRDDALGYLSGYRNFFGHGAVDCISLHYVDVVSVPKSTEFRLEDYFALYPQVPEASFGAFEMKASSRTDAGTILDLVFRRDHDDEPRGLYRFRMEWDARRQGVESTGEDVVRGHLDEMHDELRARFKPCFKARTWQSFEPQEGE